MAVATSSPTITRGELLDARKRAMDKTRQLAEQASPVPLKDLDATARHSLKALPLNLHTTVELFMEKAGQPAEFEVEALFDHLRATISDTIVSRRGTTTRVADEVRDNMIVAEQLLAALDLRAQFVEYNRAKNSIENRTSGAPER